MDKLTPPDPEELDRQVRDLFKEGDIKQTSRYSRIPYGSLTKQLNPTDPTESIAYDFLMLLYGAECAREGLGRQVWAVVSANIKQMFAPLTGDAVEMGDALAACGDFIAVAARREEGLRTPEEFEAARRDVLDKVEKVTVYPPSAHIRNFGT